MKLKHPTHDPKPMDALSYYLQVQREYALAREGYLRIDEADDTYNDLNRKIINAYRERYGTAYLGRINYSGNQRQRIADGTESVFEAYTGQPLYNFCCDFCVSAPDRTLEELIRHWNNADVPLSRKRKLMPLWTVFRYYAARLSSGINRKGREAMNYIVYGKKIGARCYGAIICMKEKLESAWFMLR